MWGFVKSEENQSRVFWEVPRSLNSTSSLTHTLCDMQAVRKRKAVQLIKGSWWTDMKFCYTVNF